MKERTQSFRMVGWSLAIILSAVAVLSTEGCSRAVRAREQAAADPPPSVAVVRVTRGSISRRLILEAELEPFQEVDVHAKVAGYVKAIYVDVGTRVRQGQLLAVLAIPELEREQDQASATVMRRKAEVARAEEELRRAESVHESIHLQASRLAAVSDSKNNLVAQQEVDDAVSKDKAAEAEISGNRAALAAARAALEDAQANVKKARDIVEYSRITAPFPGVIAKRYAHTGAMLPAGTSTTTQGMPLVKLTQNDPLRLVIFVPESAVPFIHSGTLVGVRVPVVGRTLAGTVSRFAGELDPSTRTMRTEVDVPNPKLELVPGEYADAEITLEHRENALTVPLQAVLSRDNQPAVLVVGAGDVVEKRDVSVGIESAAEIEITAGLREEDRVISSNPKQLKPGQPVQPVAPSGKEDR
ncbi:MAG TPA: efflux RND transporter periplasmic adaptor subunit [Terriglobia bacterium]|nr:efflux RND transporter periplasmic adaptor subunit [Terriglobia bacterium]